ncbi:MAG: oligopeptide ABC transporter ATP-binding protein OppF, partial [Desulfitobacterium hafniense]|nr:oligopeptide ABC transporter ATP-binding protein OppF [Desulfitobacterium hafniense]
TRALISAIPVLETDVEIQRQRIVLGGDVSSPINSHPSCAFSPRCPVALQICCEEMPSLREI